MQCERTGCYAYLKEYGCFIRGDLYIIEGVFILKFTEASRSWKPEQDRCQLVICKVEAEWKLSPWPVIIAKAEQCEYLGYEGLPTEKVMQLHA